MLEETYELVEAIHLGDPVKIKEELGDLLLQVVLQAQIAKDAGAFDIQDVADTINKKMIHRHPHVFADVSVKDAKEVVANWETLKEKERLMKDGEPEAAPKSAMDSVPKAMPALLQALKISEKAVNQGFEWRNEGEVWDKLFSELEELKEAISHPDHTHPERAHTAKREVDLEMGDVLFCLVNVGRWHALNPEESLLMAIEKFKERFRKMEELSKSPLKDLTKSQLGDLWQEAKMALK